MNFMTARGSAVYCLIAETPRFGIGSDQACHIYWICYWCCGHCWMACRGVAHERYARNHDFH